MQKSQIYETHQFIQAGNDDETTMEKMIKGCKSKNSLNVKSEINKTIICQYGYHCDNPKKLYSLMISNDRHEVNLKEYSAEDYELIK